ncbi:related to IPI1 - essential component of the Rix1 complex [Ustilago trichophora]|uniref:Pre-rRNA-processing protein n=1 Tax=Ustilago trichophora TaxID=86804 RepID=A0A5C3ECL7_9BASI|nr:related to IPI1 - essential component of the Rix1 complex [Ustilago trichophora]
MPKASKRKKEKKADFQKTKLKLGKGKQTANNATDVSFKAKTIALPQQSINADKSGKLVNSRNLTVTDLALQLRHYSAGVRREAVGGIREILTLHSSLMISDAASLIPELSRCIGDEDATVRKQLHSLLAWMLPQIPAQLLGPYNNTLLLFTTSALSHIYPEVRLDAIKVLDLCLDILPHVATAGWENAVFKMATAVSSASIATAASSVSNAAGPSNASHQPHGERIMNCFFNLVGITQRSTAAASITATDLAPGAKLLILKSLRTFLSHALPITSGDDIEDINNSELRCPTWFFRSAFPSFAEFEYFQKLLGRHTDSSHSRSVSVQRSTNQNANVTAVKAMETSYGDWTCSDWAASSLMDLDTTSGKSLSHIDLFNSLQAAMASAPPLDKAAIGAVSGKQTRSAALSLYTLLDPVLLASFLDTAPSAFQPDLDLSQQLRGQNVGLSTHSQLVFEIIQLLLALWRGSSSPSAQARTSLANMLGHVSIYFPFSHHTSSGGLSVKAKSAVVQMDLAYAELAALLALNNSAKPQKSKSRFDAEVQIASVSAFIAELLSVPVTESGTVSLGSAGASASNVLDPDTFRALLPTLWFLLGTDRETLLDSLLATYHAHATQHRVKPVLFEFLARAFSLSKLRAQTPFTAAESERILDSLLSTLPRSLFEAALSNSSHNFAGIQLEFLHFLLSLPSPPTTLVYDQLGPFYWIKHPIKKTSAPGPYCKLPQRLRKVALDIISLLQGRSDKLDKTLHAALQRAQTTK